MCAHFFNELLWLYTRGVHGQAAGCTLYEPVRPDGAQNKSLISNTVYVPIVDRASHILSLMTLLGARAVKATESDMFSGLFVCLFVCGISLTSGQLFNELFPDCTRPYFSQVVLRHRGGDRIYK